MPARQARSLRPREREVERRLHREGGARNELERRVFDAAAKLERDLHLKREAAELAGGLRAVPAIGPLTRQRLEVLEIERLDVLAQDIDDAALRRLDVDVLR